MDGYCKKQNVQESCGMPADRSRAGKFIFDQGGILWTMKWFPEKGINSLTITVKFKEASIQLYGRPFMSGL